MNLFPRRKPYRKGYFPVTDGHKIYYELYGNQKGIPVLFVHGGPGAGCGKYAYRHFNPKKFNILAVDQRGAGKSKPYASWKSNTTQKLVEDFRNFLKFLGIKKIFLFGGSWGSCLSLCYAIKYPENVLGMVLRGIYLGSSFENDYLLNGNPRSHFPEAWKRFVGMVPKGRKVLQFYWKMMNSKNKKTAYKFCREWAMYEGSVLHLEYDAKKVNKETRGKWIVPLSKLEAWYMMHDCFLSKDYILKRLDKIKNIPLSIVHGRYDFVCPPQNAYVLHNKLSKSKLFFVTAGHSASDPAIREAMMKEIHRMAKRL